VLSRVKDQTQTVLNSIDQAEVRTRQMTRALKGVETLPETRAQQLLPGLLDPDSPDEDAPGG
jgi:DNA recombination protein RmuC